KYKILKEILIEDLDVFIKPFRENREKLSKNIAEVKKVLENGAVKAKDIADKKLLIVKKNIGVI
ncbi:MAG: tryptophan--tRNA ligase, partial [Patescibacteria group bacterium]